MAMFSKGFSLSENRSEHTDMLAEIAAVRPDDFDHWLLLWQGCQKFYGVDIAREVT